MLPKSANVGSQIDESVRFEIFEKATVFVMFSMKRVSRKVRK